MPVARRRGFFFVLSWRVCVFKDDGSRPAPPPLKDLRRGRRDPQQGSPGKQARVSQMERTAAALASEQASGSGGVDSPAIENRPRGGTDEPGEEDAPDDIDDLDGDGVADEVPPPPPAE